MVGWGSRLALQASPRASIEFARTNSETDQRADMAAFTVPTLIVHGDSDSGCPLELTGGRTAALIPGSRLRVYENAPHGLPFTHQDRLNADLLEFIRG
jgi:pimeloyl-ACP methyl ester carboxylesterase